MDDVIKNNDYYHISNWPICNPNGVFHHERFYMIYIGESSRFIMMRGKFVSAPHPDTYWEGNGQQRFWVGLYIEQYIHYTKGPVLDVACLSKEIPSVDWLGNNHENILTEEESEKLEQMWKKHVEQHDADFHNPALVRHFEDEYLNMGIGERARKRIVGVEKLDAFFGADNSCLHDAIIEKVDYDRDKMELTVWVDNCCPKWSFDGNNTVYMIPFCFKDVYEFMMDIEPRNDYMCEAKIYQEGNSIHAIFESAHIEVNSSELEIGEVVEMKCDDRGNGNKFKF